MVMKECPKCGSFDIDIGERRSVLGQAAIIGYNSTNRKGILPKYDKTETYVCLNCGYLETYIKDLEKLKQKLSK